MEQESDVVYPCKGCGEVRHTLEYVQYTYTNKDEQILEEGKAFELGRLTYVYMTNMNMC